MLLCFDEGLTLETSAFQLITVANLHFQLSWYNQITMLSYRSPLFKYSSPSTGIFRTNVTSSQLVW